MPQWTLAVVLPVPLGVIIPKKVDHVLAAGRCIGAPDTIDTFRLICPCFVTGQAAGTLAALAAASGKAPLVTEEMSMLVLPTITPDARLTTLCATSKTPMTMFHVFVTISTAAADLNAHLKNIQVSRS